MNNKPLSIICSRSCSIFNETERVRVVLNNDQLKNILEGELIFKQARYTYKFDYFDLYSLMKSLFFNSNSNDWRTRDTIKYIKSLNVNIDIFVNTVNSCFTTIQESTKKGVKSDNKFLELLNTKYSQKIKILPNITNIEFLINLKEFKESNFNMTNNEFIDFVYNNFDLKLSRSTLRNYFYQK